MYRNIKIKPFDRNKYREIRDQIREKKLNTVCMEANCPNRYECFSQGTATFMILGDICTRNCRYCNVRKGVPKRPNPEEPRIIRETIEKMNLNYAVITCVTRDDLEDGGAGHFCEVVKEIRKIPGCKIELLISDLDGNFDALKRIVNSRPDVLNHNIEVVRDLFPKLRPKGSYELSLEILKRAKMESPELFTKSGFMVGLGETRKQIFATLRELLENQCNMVTIGQYLQPSSAHAKIEKFYTDQEFLELKTIALRMGFDGVESGVLVRSSYHAKDMVRH
jgi:lipoic acid synthetase